MCAFDRERDDGSGCHFTVYDSNSCYLGSLSGETALLNASPVTSADLQLKDGKIANSSFIRKIYISNNCSNSFKFIF